MSNTIPVSDIVPETGLLLADEIEAVNGGDAVNTFLNVVSYTGQKTCVGKTYVLGSHGYVELPCPPHT